MSHCRGLVLLIFLVCLPAFGADITVAGVDVNDLLCNPLKKKVCFTFLIQGPINKGDNKAFIALINKFTKASSRVGKVHFDSPGGDLFEAMEIGRTIRRGLMATQVTSDSRCFSACVLAFVSGVVRVPVGPVGVHSFYSKEFIGVEEFDRANARHNEVAAKVEAYLKEMRVPIALLDAMQSTPSYTLREIKVHEWERLGLIGVDPVYGQLLHNR